MQETKPWGRTSISLQFTDFLIVSLSNHALEMSVKGPQLDPGQDRMAISTRRWISSRPMPLAA